MNGLLRSVPKNKDGLTPPKLEHFLLFIAGICFLAFGREYYEACSQVGKVIVLIIYLGLLVGVAPMPMPVFKSRFWQVMFAGLISGVLDSYIVLDQSRRMRTVEAGQDKYAVMAQKENQPTEGTRAVFLALLMMAALVGGLIVWFGEVYAAGTYLNDNRTGVFSCLFIVPPVLVFLAILGLHANRLDLEVVPNAAVQAGKRDLVEFAAGVVALLVLHNPLICLGGLLVYAVVTRQDDHLLHVFKHETEVNVMLVLVIALFGGNWVVQNWIAPLGLDSGTALPIIPAGIQAVLWGPLYTDPSVHHWERIMTLSTGALLLPISSLVGVMLFRSIHQWLLYMRYSLVYAALWYAIMRGWIWLTLESPTGRFLEQWAHSGGSH